jgi:transposase
MPFTAEAITLNGDEQAELEQMTQSRMLPAGDVFRARLILILAEGVPYRTIPERRETTAPTISRGKNRFLEQGVAGLLEMRHPGQKPSVITPALQAQVLELCRRPPKDGSTHWSCRKLAKTLKVSQDTVQRILHQAGLKPHRRKRYRASNDPDFERKAADIIGLYLNPPQHAAVFCVDEKSAIQALDRLDPVLPMSPGRIERHGLEYYRHGTLSLYAALEVHTGKVHGTTAARHTSEEFVKFLHQVAGQSNRSRRSTSSWIIFPRIKPRRWMPFSKTIPRFISTSRPPIHPG